MKTSMAGVVFFAFAVIWSPVALAETVVAESLEWVVADSDCVFTGKVVKVEKVFGRKKKEYELATVAVTKTFKGLHNRQVTFLVQNYFGPAAKGWLDAGTPMLFCLVQGQRVKKDLPLAAKFAWVLRDDGNHHCAVSLGAQRAKTMQVFTREFTVLTKPEAILKWVEEAAKIRNAKSHTIDVPSNTAVYDELYSESTVELILPIDGNLEKLGRDWCRSPSSIQRKDGAEILRHFKNEKNIDILKPLLEDQCFSIVTSARTVPGKQELELLYRKKSYYVRQAAYQALREFGVQVGQPVLEELLEGKN